MHAPPRPSLPTDRAFVVQLSADADPGTCRLSGRVEHVISGESAHFGSLEQLLAFIAGMTSDGPQP